jgi:hypothetical protein
LEKSIESRIGMDQVDKIGNIDFANLKMRCRSHRDDGMLFGTNSVGKNQPGANGNIA